LRFDNRFWLIDVYKDNSDQIVFEKASKIGITEWMLSDLMVHARAGRSGMYVFPDQLLRNRFISSRVDPIVRAVPEYVQHMSVHEKDVDEKGLKTFYNSTWAFVGSNNPKTFYEFDAQVMLYDELDQCNPESLIVAEDRTGAAERNIWRKVGNPTISGFGIDAEYENSDKKSWHIRCEHCGEWQPLNWFVNVVGEADESPFWRLLCEGSSGPSLQSNGGDAPIVCRRCKKAIDRLAPGEWIAEHPGRSVSGYQASRIFGAPGNDNPEYTRPIIREMFDDWIKAQGDQTRLQRFYNNILGVPYAAAGSQITLDLMQGCVDPEYLMPETAEGTVAGVDIGKRHHLRIDKLEKNERGDTIRRAVFIGSVASYDELARIIDLYGVQCGVMDAQGEIHPQREFVENRPGWYLCNYNKGADAVKQEYIVDHANQTVRVNRTESMDRAHAEYVRRLVILPKNLVSLDNGDFVAQMSAPTRVLKDGPVPRYIWDEGNKADHHCHANNYASIAAQIMGGNESLITII